jgi:hypothetical protein
LIFGLSQWGLPLSFPLLHRSGVRGFLLLTDQSLPGLSLLPGQRSTFSRLIEQTHPQIAPSRLAEAARSLSPR